MYFIRQQLEQFRRIDYPLTREPDFDAFWEAAVQRVRKHELHARCVPLIDYPCNGIRISDVTLHALDGTPLRAWYYLPAEAAPERPVPGVVFLHGGEGSRGKYPGGMALNYALTGCAVLQTEFRLQGGTTVSYTPMHRCADSFATNNLDCEKPQDNYFFHAFTDQLLLTRWLLEQPAIDTGRAAAMGASQGGGTALILAALEPRIALCLSAVPSFCCWEQRVFGRTACASMMARYLRFYPEKTESMFRTLSYFDAMNFADRIRGRVKMQICLKDASAPPDCAFAAYNRLSCPRSLQINPLGEHADVDTKQWQYDLWELSGHAVNHPATYFADTEFLL